MKKLILETVEGKTFKHTITDIKEGNNFVIVKCIDGSESWIPSNRVFSIQVIDDELPAEIGE